MKSKEKKQTLICWLLRIAEGTSFCFSQLSSVKILAYGQRRLSIDYKHFRTV